MFAPRCLAELEDPLAVPGRHELERVVGRELDPRALDERVDVPDVDELRAARRRRSRRSARASSSWLELGGDADDLARLDVRADRDGEVGEPGEIGVGHRAKPTRHGIGFAARYQPIVATICGGATAAAGPARIALAAGQVEVAGRGRAAPAPGPRGAQHEPVRLEQRADVDLRRAGACATGRGRARSGRARSRPAGRPARSGRSPARGRRGASRAPSRRRRAPAGRRGAASGGRR